jgi:hypothetical protein
VIGVRFAKAKAAHFGNVASLLDSGNTHLVYVIAPPGKVGTSVLISVETLESLKAGRGYTRGVRTATFTYVK